MERASLNAISQLISTCVYGRIPKKDVHQVLTLLAEAVPAFLARGTEVTIHTLGTFSVNEKGQVKFSISEKLKERVKEQTGGSAKPTRRYRKCQKRSCMSSSSPVQRSSSCGENSSSGRRRSY